MLSVTSRWKLKPAAPVSRVAIASGDGGAMFFDEKGLVSFVDADARPLWSVPAEDSLRRIAMPAAGKGGFVLGVRALERYGASGKVLWRAEVPPFPIDLGVRADGGALVVGADSGTVRVCQPNGRELWTRRLPHGADYVALAPDSTAVLAVSRRGDVTFLAPDGTPVWKVALGCEALHPDLRPDRIVVPSFDGVQAFGPDGAALGVYDVGAPTVRAQFAKNGEWLLVQDAKRRLLLLDAGTGDTRWELAWPEEPRDVAIAPDGSAILIATWAGELERLDMSDVARATTSVSAGAAAGATGAYLEVDGAGTSDLSPKPRWRVPVEGAGPASLVVLPAGSGVAVLDPQLATLAMMKGDPLPAWGAAHLGTGAMLAAGAAGTPIAVAGSRGLRIFDPADGEIGNAPVVAKHLAVARDGGAILVGSADARLHLYDARGAALWDVPTPGFDALAISPDAQTIAIVRGGTVSVQRRNGQGGFSKAMAPVRAQVVAELLDDGIFYATSEGHVGVLSGAGEAGKTDRLPPGFGPERVVVVGTNLLVVTGGGTFRFDREAGRCVPLKGGPASHAGGALWSVFMDRLLEFRYDSKEIACLDVRDGTLLWKRALPGLPRALSISAEGSALAGIVAGELVLYDLVPRAAEPAGSGSPPVETPPTFLEL